MRDQYVMADQEYTTISIHPPVRDRLRSLKRGQESYDELLEKMAQAYDPDAPEGNA